MNSLPETLTEMNKYFVIHTIYRHMNKSTVSEECVVNDLKDLPDNMYKIVRRLSKLAFNGLRKNQLVPVFSHNEIKELCPEIDRTPGAINGFGLLQAV